MLVVDGVVGETLLSPNVPCARTGAARTLVATRAIAILRNMTSPFCHLGPYGRPRGLNHRGNADLSIPLRFPGSISYCTCCSMSLSHLKCTVTLLIYTVTGI